MIGADNVDGFLDAAAFGDDVFDDQHRFFGGDFESASKDESAFLLFGENESAGELAGDFLAQDESAHGGGNDSGWFEVADFCREGGADFLNDGHLLEGEGALEILTAVQTAAEDEMTFQQGTRVPEDLKHFVFGHGSILGCRLQVPSSKLPGRVRKSDCGCGIAKPENPKQRPEPEVAFFWIPDSGF